MSAQKHVCLVTPGHLSTNPRLVKEADALFTAGYRVSVVASRFIGWADDADREFESRPWLVRKVVFGPLAGRWRHLSASFARRLCEQINKLTGSFAELALHPAVPALKRAACQVKADFYIAHNLAALPAASQAARQHNACLVFDAEDFHSGEFTDSPTGSFRKQLVQKIERKYLRQCDLVTAASPGIAEAYAGTYGIPMPHVVLNVFPLAEAPSMQRPLRTSGERSLYWFSQTIGPNRGLEAAIQAVALSRSKPALFVRGHGSDDYLAQLSGIASKLGVADRLHFLPPARPSDMVNLAAEHDIGLASETGFSLNNELALSNKVFTYLLAGLPVLISDTQAQTRLSEEASGAVARFHKGDPESLGQAIDALLEHPETLAAARVEAWTCSRQRFNWDFEQQKWLSAIRKTLGNPCHERLENR